MLVIIDPHAIELDKLILCRVPDLDTAYVVKKALVYPNAIIAENFEELKPELVEKIYRRMNVDSCFSLGFLFERVLNHEEDFVYDSIIRTCAKPIDPIAEKVGGKLRRMNIGERVRDFFTRGKRGTREELEEIFEMPWSKLSQHISNLRSGRGQKAKMKILVDKETKEYYHAHHTVL